MDGTIIVQGRKRGIANNNRYLILPWVEVPHLASHVLGLLARRIRKDIYLYPLTPNFRQELQA